MITRERLIKGIGENSFRQTYLMSFLHEFLSRMMKDTFQLNYVKNAIYLIILHASILKFRRNIFSEAIHSILFEMDYKGIYGG